MNLKTTTETPTPETLAAPARKRRPRSKDIAALREQIDRHAYRHMRTHDHIRTLIVNLMEISADAKNGWEEAAETRHNLNLAATPDETTN